MTIKNGDWQLIRSQITAKNLIRTVEEICSIGPRIMATEGEHKAMEYIEKYFKISGLRTEVTWIEGVVSWKEVYARARVIKPLEYEMTCHAVPGSSSTPEEGIVGEVIYVGRGHESDYVGKNVKDKIVLHDPPYVRRTDNPGFDEVIDRATKKGAKGVIEYSEVRGKGLVQPRNTGRKGVEIPVVCVTYQDGVYLKELINEWYAEPRGWIVTQKIPVEVWIKTKVIKQEGKTGYVEGILEGTDLKDEEIIVVAHHDSPGMGLGANDNASGISVVLNVARAFTSGPRPRRTIRFVTVGGEEYGYVGSEFYAKKLSESKRKVKAVIVLDLVGVGSKHVYCVEGMYGGQVRRTSQWLNNLIVKTAEELGYLLEPTTVDFTSDDGPFIAMGFPTSYIGPRLLPDTVQFHTYLDTPDNLDPNDLKVTADIVSAVLWRLAFMENLNIST